MNKKRKFVNSSLWWLDTNILNTENIKFKYSYESNIFFLKISKLFYYYYFLINKKNLNSLMFSNLDSVLISSSNKNNYYLAGQTIFCDFKFMLEVYSNTHLHSISGIYSGNSWVEREVKEFNKVFFINLNDSRKLLLNYNYNETINYNHYNNIIGDINI